MQYKKAGVDIKAGDVVKRRIGEYVKSTFNKNVYGKFGSFGGMFGFKSKDFKSPVLVSSIDGVGTKIKVASMMNKYDTVGIDLVNHCINDILVQGARPLFFLDYIAMSKLDKNIIQETIKGLACACKKSNCVLIGGETAQMPGIYIKGEYDLAGCIIGVVEKNKIIDGKNILPGDKIIGLASTGLHTNGYSLVRKLLFEEKKYKVTTYLSELKCTIGEELLKSHKSYLTSVTHLLNSKFTIKAMAHITGGGFPGNISRILPSGLNAVLKKDSWIIPPIFKFLQKTGKISDIEMYDVFNMGIGMILIVSQSQVKNIITQLGKFKEKAWQIGEIQKSNSKTSSPQVLII